MNDRPPITIMTIANFRDLDPAGIEITEGITATAACRENRECVQETVTVKCSIGFEDCYEHVQTGGENSPSSKKTRKRNKASLVQRDRRENARVAFAAIIRANANSPSLGTDDTPKGKPYFNCNAATQPVERAICADDSLAARDRNLNELYQRLSHSLSGERRNLIDKQRAWVRSGGSVY